MISIRIFLAMAVSASLAPSQSAVRVVPPEFSHLEFSPAPDLSLADGPRHGFWRTARNAGANALFVAMHGHGMAVDYADVVDAVEVTARGANLESLAAAARRLGLPMEPALAGPDTLGSYPLPALLHLDPLAQHVQQGGRITVLAAVDEGERRATVLDGVTGIPSSVSLDALFQVWSGALLAMAPHGPPRSVAQMWGMLLGAALCGLGLGGALAARRGHS